MKGCAGPVEATSMPRHRHPGDLEPADYGGIEYAVSKWQQTERLSVETTSQPTNRALPAGLQFEDTRPLQIT